MDMKYLGIDYGKKRTGLAVSSDDASIAFPLRVIETTHTLANTIAEIIDQEHIEKIVIGESKDRAGNDNSIMEDVRDLMGQLSLLVAIPIDTQREDFSTSSAMRSMIPEKNVTRSRTKKPTGDSDARAAALILQRYLDKT
ncbi:MAG: Holliday junction resolvase RuvX [Candidatus Pacebacteria bacterium]|nr:Holliday junction resolvase RuvX [Candidatus Paceibacterota bacterium]